MTTLYKPILIESAEHAEALPQGAILLGGHLDEPWDLTNFFCDQDGGAPAALLDALTAGVRVTALVPIEAEDEAAGALVNRAGDIHWEESRRRVTPWEPV